MGETQPKLNGTEGRGAIVRGEVVHGAARGRLPGRKEYLIRSPNHLEMISLRVLEVKMPLLHLLRSEPRLGSPAFDRREKRGIPHAASLSAGRGSLDA